VNPLWLLQRLIMTQSNTTVAYSCPGAGFMNEIFHFSTCINNCLQSNRNIALSCPGTGLMFGIFHFSRCIKNCLDLVNPQRLLHLRGRCLSCAEREDVVYGWEVQKNGATVRVASSRATGTRQCTMTYDHKEKLNEKEIKNNVNDN
jgi:hypothetical protein